MTILIFLAVILVTIVLAIFINRLVRCPLLVGGIFFSIALLVAVILSNTTLVILAIILGIVAFLVAFFDCIFKSSRFFRNNNCIRCHNPYDDDEDGDDDNDCCQRGRCRRRPRNNNCCNCPNDDTLRIINSNGDVVARISGNSINCYDNNDNNGCGCSGRTGNSVLLSDATDGNVLNTTNTNVTTNTSSCGCGSRGYRRI